MTTVNEHLGSHEARAELEALAELVPIEVRHL
jgi:hypothetical protein